MFFFLQRYYQFVGNFCVNLQAKNNCIPHAFLEISKRYANLFWIIWACLAMYIQTDSINLLKTSIFICLPKINFVIHFFLEVLHFKESYNLILPLCLKSLQNSCRIFALYLACNFAEN